MKMDPDFTICLCLTTNHIPAINHDWMTNAFSFNLGLAHFSLESQQWPGNRQSQSPYEGLALGHQKPSRQYLKSEMAIFTQTTGTDCIMPWKANILFFIADIFYVIRYAWLYMLYILLEIPQFSSIADLQKKSVKCLCLCFAKWRDLMKMPRKWNQWHLDS